MYTSQYMEKKGFIPKRSDKPPYLSNECNKHSNTTGVLGVGINGICDHYRGDKLVAERCDGSADNW